MKPEELFTPENTIWETDVDDEGNTSKHLVYVGSLEDLAKENNISVYPVFPSLSFILFAFVHIYFVSFIFIQSFEFIL